MMYQVTHDLLTLAGDSIYFNTNLGAVAAINIDDGQPAMGQPISSPPTWRPCFARIALAARFESLPVSSGHALCGPGR